MKKIITLLAILICTFASGQEPKQYIDANNTQVVGLQEKGDSITTFDGDGKFGYILKSSITSIINIEDFGAVGDGITESAQFIQDALDYAEANGIRRVYAPAGTYLLEKTIYIPTEIEFFGDGIEQTVFSINNDTEIDEIEMFSGVADVRNFYNPVISTKTTRTGDTLEDIYLRDFQINDIDFDDTGRRGYLVPMLILNTHNSKIENVKFGNIVTERDRNGVRRVSMGLSLAFAENILIDRCIHGFAEYEGLSIRFLSKNITSRNNVFNIDRPTNLEPMVHAVQTAMPPTFIDAIENYYGETKCRNYISDGDVFNLTDNVRHAVTSHTSSDIKITKSTVNASSSSQVAQVFKFFDNSGDVVMHANVINFIDEGTAINDIYSNGIIAISTTVGHQESSRAIISDNILNLELNRDVSGYDENDISALIGNLRESYHNATISNNIVNINGTGVRDQAVFGFRGTNINASGNVVNFDGDVSENMRAFVVEGGDRINVINNSTIGIHAYSLKVNDVESLDNLIIGGNNFPEEILNNQPTKTRTLAYEEDHYTQAQINDTLSYYPLTSALGTVALSNDYGDLDNTPTIPAQVNLIEGSNITISGTYPNLTVSASGTVGANWDDIGGDQSDINISGFTNDSAFITENQTITLSGDVTGSGTTSINTAIANDAVNNDKLANMAANTVKVRAAGTTGDPTDLTLNQNNLLGRGSTGNIAPITLGTNLSFDGAVLNATGGGATVLNDLSDVDVDGGQSDRDVLAWSASDGYFTPIPHIGAGGSAHALATTSEHGFMSSTDKAYLSVLQKTPSAYYHRTHFIGAYETKTGSSSAQTWDNFRSGNNIIVAGDRSNGKEFQGKMFLTINRAVRPSTTTISVTFEDTSFSIDVGDLGLNNICFVEVDYSLYFHSGNIAEILYNYKIYNAGYGEGIYILFGSSGSTYTNSGSRSVVIQTTTDAMNSITMIKNELIAVN